ncbi:glycosyltransferase family 39 protein [Candidatus Woesearchaeota archaeon]|nr:glycosyltransferase family 39 protein [Candidatus Woesearchaeota archaeon]
MKLRPEHIALALVVLAAFFYLNLDGLPLTHPGNIKAADPFYHTAATENILDTNQWLYYPAWVGFGRTNVPNVQPPLLYMQAAALSSWSGLPSWTTVYFIVGLFAALGVGMAFFLVQRVFNHQVALLAAFALVLPLRPFAWLYGIYIGLWIQVVSFMAVIGFVWMAVAYWQDKQRWQLWIANCAITIIMLVHPQDLIAVFPLWLALAWKAWKNPERIKNILALISISAIAFTVLLPHWIWVWGGRSSNLAPGWYTTQESAFGTGYSGGLVLPEPTFFPWYVLFFGIFGFCLMLPRWKKNLPWIIGIAAMLFISYVTPFVLKDPYYLLRLRALFPYIILPAAAFAIVALLSMFRLHDVLRWIAVFIVGVLALITGYVQYRELPAQLSGEHLPLERWNSYLWLQSNTAMNSTLFMLEGTSQANPTMTKRITAQVDIQELARKAQLYAINQTLDQFWTVEWNAATLRDAHIQRTGLFSFSTYPEGPSKVDINDFDYVYFENLNEGIAQFNAVIAQRLLNQSYRAVYQQGSIFILRRQ